MDNLSLYEVTMRVEVQACDEAEAKEKARCAFRDGAGHYYDLERIKYDDCDAAFERAGDR